MRTGHGKAATLFAYHVQSRSLAASTAFSSANRTRRPMLKVLRMDLGVCIAMCGKRVTNHFPSQIYSYAYGNE
jgi:hypothetical protein